MKRYFSLIVLLASFTLLIGGTACNSKKKAADKEARERQEKLDKADQDKRRFEQSLPAADM